MLKRRKFLQTTLAGAALCAGMDRLALANTGAEARLLLVILRGGMDGLAAVPAYGESHYKKLRGSLALAAPNKHNGVLALDGLFALHPNLKNLHALYHRKQLLIAHAVATSYRERSHFDGQKQLENGSDSPLGADDGWLNRTLSCMPAGRNAAIALAQNIPLVLSGEAKVNSWSPAQLPEVEAETIARIAGMYEADAFFSAQFQSALQTRAMVEEIADGNKMANGRARANRNIEVLVKAAGKFLQDQNGPRIAVIESSGWDTHANQGAAQGQLANQFTQLDANISSLQQELGEAWRQTVVLVVSEFGRTVAVNGSNGTDHGTGNVAFVVGGAVNGGRVISDWPGLAKANLYEGRDLQATMDIRSLFKSILHDHLHVAGLSLEKTIFPDSSKAKMIPDLLIS